MDRPIAVVGADKEECQELCAVLEREDYKTVGLDSLVNLESYMQKGACRVVILDLDTLPVNNRFIVDLRKQNPRLPIIVLSSRQYHPELQQAMSTDICACLSKPPDPDELIYCLRSFCDNGSK
jgi:DNA-binding NtrC family response regulator